MKKSLLKDYAAKMTIERRSISPDAAAVSAVEAEGEIIRIIQNVARHLAPIYRFGYHTVEDIEQEGVIFALKILDKGVYDVKRPLENFIHIHMRNRLYNNKRDNYMRPESPCKCCDPLKPPAFPCQKYTDWQARNTAKQNLMKPLDMSGISDESESNMRHESEIEETANIDELKYLIDRELPIDLRRDYLQLQNGKTISKARRERVKEAVLDIIKGKGYLDGKEI